VVPAGFSTHPTVGLQRRELRDVPGLDMATKIRMGTSCIETWVRGVIPAKLVPRAGKMSTLLALGGMPGMGNSAVCVEVMTCWLATWTEMGLVVVWVCGRGVLAEK
jgi:hypothetical protein